APSDGVRVDSWTPPQNQLVRGKSWRARTSDSPPSAGVSRTSTCDSPLPRSRAVTRSCVPRPMVSPRPSTLTVGAKGSKNMAPRTTAATSPSPMRSARIRSSVTLFRRANQPGCLGEHIEEVSRDAVGRSPDDLSGDREEPNRNLTTVEVPQLLALDAGRGQVVHGDGEDRVHFARTGAPRVGMRDHADHGCDAEARRHGLDVVEAAEHANVGGAQSDLLVRLAQRGGLGVGVAFVPAATRKR